MKQYLDLLQRVLSEGTRQSNRTGTDTIFVPGDMMRFDLTQGFPIVTTRKGYWKSAVGEMIAFLNGYQDAGKFRQLKCAFWDKNANDPGKPESPNQWLTNPYRKGTDDLGRVYGAQWRDWQAYAPIAEDSSEYERMEPVDQLRNAIDLILNNPTSRRILVSAWRPDELNQMALPPCHVLFQFLCNVEKKELNLSMYIRSNDLFLGAPANIVEYAWLLEAVAHATGYTAKWFTYFVSDAHIYVNHVEQVETQLSREPYPLPTLAFNLPYLGVRDVSSVLEWLCNLHPDDFGIVNYKHHPELKGDMAV